MMMMKARGFGWIPDIPDARDAHYRVRRVKALPLSIDLRPACPPVYDQGQLGSCTAFAITSAVEYQHKAQGYPDQHLSELFVYYCERLLEHTTHYDSGAYIRDGMKVVNKYGACREERWPYDISKFTRRPPQGAFSNALKEQTLRYARVEQGAIRDVLATNKPVVFGFSVYTSFLSDEVARTGGVPMPDLAHERVEGGHAVLAVGYTEGGTYLCRNSWGTEWGMEGYFTLPAAYVENPNMADDFWVVDLVEQGETL